MKKEHDGAQHKSFVAGDRVLTPTLGNNPLFYYKINRINFINVKTYAVLKSQVKAAQDYSQQWSIKKVKYN